MTSNSPTGEPIVQRPGTWTVEEAERLYDVAAWGDGYVSINASGHVCVHPSRQPEHSIDLADLVSQLEERGINLPVLLRFGGILENRILRIHEAFDRAIVDHDYRGTQRTVYPIKVNQQRQVVEEMKRFGNRTGLRFGFEAGSKAELLAILGTCRRQTPIVCNGFKDTEYIETVVMAQKIGCDITPVIERSRELDLLIRLAREHDVQAPQIGLRVKLATSGAGRWRDSAGYKSKFGLTAEEALRGLEQLRAVGLEQQLKLLHFHMGSQITNVRPIKSAVAEAARIYVELVRLGAGLEILDVGGGLGVDYDGSQSNTESSINYTLQEYANDVVKAIGNICDEAEVEHPAIVTECGRALTAHHAALVFNVLGVDPDDRSPSIDVAAGSGSGEGQASPLPSPLPDDAAPLQDLFETVACIEPGNLVECFHDAQQALDESLQLFSLGYLTLESRARAETLYWHICDRIRQELGELDYVPEELARLETLAARTYFCNFSLFQSLPDAWAIDHLFPVMPIHRLDERPSTRGVLADISCDSDGKLDRFIGRRETQVSLPLHPVEERDGELAPYRIGVFLVGAYQEILGDLHNLLGDTNAVHVSYDPKTGPVIEDVVEGDRVREVLHYVQFEVDDLLRSFRKNVEQAVREKKITPSDSGRMLRFYESGLEGYTYLE